MKQIYRTVLLKLPSSKSQRNEEKETKAHRSSLCPMERGNVKMMSYSPIAKLIEKMWTA